MDERPPAVFNQGHLLKMKAFLDSRGVELECPLCKGGDFAIEGITHWPEVTYRLDGPITTSGGTIPIALITCKNCSHTMTFNAYRMDVLP